MRRALLTIAASGALLAPFVPAGADEPIEDLTPPQLFITRQPGHANGWYATAPTVNIRATDDHPFSSGVRFVSYTMTGANTGQGTVDRLTGGTVALSGAAGQTEIQVEAADGNDNHAFGMTTVGVDPNPPTATFTGRLQQGALFAQGEVVPAAYACSDAHSGVLSCAGTQPAGAQLDTSTIGDHTFTVTATDNVGRVTTRTVAYQVAAADIQVVRDAVMPARAQVGQPLTPTAPEFSPQPDSIGYRWSRNGTVIPGVASLNYTPTADDADRQLWLIAVARRAGFRDRTISSQFVHVDPAPISVEGDPVLEGEARYGSELTVAHGPVTPASATLDYQWLRDGALIPEASGLRYWPDVADVGHRISARVVAQAPGHTTRTWVTEESAPVRGLALDVTGTTSVRGTMRVGSVLTAVPPSIREQRPSLAPGDAATLSYTWLRDGRPIADAEAATYLLQPADAGRRVSLAVTGTAPGYDPAVSTSPAGAAVQKATPVVRATLEALGKQKARLTVSVAAPGVKPTGTVTVKRGSKILARATALRAGRLVLTLTKQPKGKTTYVVSYSGAPGIAPRKVKISGRIR